MPHVYNSYQSGIMKTTYLRRQPESAVRSGFPTLHPRVHGVDLSEWLKVEIITRPGLGGGIYPNVLRPSNEMPIQG